MDYHLDYKLNFNASPEHKNLYQWAIVEVDEKGKDVGVDQIPWVWSLCFLATSYGVSDQFQVEKPSEVPRSFGPKAREVTETESITLKLKPADSDHPRLRFENTDYSMLGTKRRITDFRLDIRKLSDPSREEEFGAWGFGRVHLGGRFPARARGGLRGLQPPRQARYLRADGGEAPEGIDQRGHS